MAELFDSADVKDEGMSLNQNLRWQCCRMI